MNLKKEITLSDLVPKGLSLPSRPGGGAPRKREAAPRELVGLKVGATGLTAAHVVSNGHRELVKFARAPLAHGIIDGGEVRDPAALGSALSAFFAEHGLPKRGVRLGLANSRIGVRLIEISGIEDERQLENAIGFRAHEMLSVPADEAVLDYHVLGTDVDEEGATTRRILLVVAYRESIDRYLAATDAAGLDLAGIDLEAFALLRARGEPAEPDSALEAALVAVSIGHERTTLAISNGHVCQFTRVLEWGGGTLGLAIARALKIAPSEAEDLKCELSFASAPAPAGTLPPPKVAEALEAARYELQTLVRELLSSLRFYQSQPDSLAIGGILLSGGVADMPGFADELERELGVGVTVADPLGRVQLADGLEPPERLGSLATAVGLGIED
jgi:type IV pilus assembly protein PilM